MNIYMDIRKNRYVDQSNKQYRNHYTFSLLVLFACALLFMGCASKKNDEMKAVTVYYLNSEENSLYTFDTFIDDENAERMVTDLLDLLSVPSDKLIYKNAIGSCYDLLGYEFTEDHLILNFSEDYYNQDALIEILNRAAIVKTLTQLDEVNSVSFLVENSPINDINGNPIGVMTYDQFITNAGNEINAHEQVDLTLYFANDSGDGLIEVKRNVVYSSNISIDRLVLDELLKGPLEKEDGFETVSPTVKVISTTITDGVCYVSFDASFLSQKVMVSPEVTIYSIVNSLIEIPGINKVQISIDGDTAMQFREKMPLSEIYERNLELLD